MAADLVLAFTVVSLASAAIGAWLEYLGHSMHYGHKHDE